LFTAFGFRLRDTLAAVTAALALEGIPDPVAGDLGDAVPFGRVNQFRLEALRVGVLDVRCEEFIDEYLGVRTALPEP
jgi:hypothetical protein